MSEDDLAAVILVGLMEAIRDGLHAAASPPLGQTPAYRLEVLYEQQKMRARELAAACLALAPAAPERRTRTR